MERRKWWEGLVGVLQSFADIAYQRRAWLVPGSDATSPVEMYCQLFDDELFESFYETYGGSFTTEQRDTWNAFAEALETCGAKINEQISPAELLVQPCWKIVQLRAEMLLLSFNESPMRSME